MIDKIEMLIALAREEHFGRAAIAQGVAQATQSKAIKQLEDQLSVMLVWHGRVCQATCGWPSFQPR
jgi:DNA-binding transcriptional LysR family regulator